MTDPLPEGHPDRWLLGAAQTGSIRIELGGIAEISAEFGVPRTTASMWGSRRESNGFPEPLANLAAGPVFDMAAVRRWYAETYPEVQP